MGSLTEEQQAVIEGCLLGDGAMRCKANALLEINHCLEQRSYVDWKYQVLKGLVSTAPKARNGNGDRMAYRFTTRSLSELTAFYRRFYPEGKKRIPRDLHLTPLSVAVWFMDDGCKSHRALYLNTQQFSQIEQEYLAGLLKERWGIEATLNRDKTYRRLRIRVGSVGRFRGVVEPHMLAELMYKFPG